MRAALVEAEFYAGLGIHLDRLDGLDPGTRPRFPPVRTASRGDDLIGRLLTYAGRIDDGLAILRGMYERASVEGRSTLPAILGWMAEAQIMAGRFAAAAELTREAIERAEETGGDGGTPWEVGFHAVALAMLGRLDEAEAAATRVLDLAEADPTVGLDEAPARLALGIIAMARGRFADAAAHLRHLDQAKREAGIREPRLCAHASDLIEALVGRGRAGRGRRGARPLRGRGRRRPTGSGRWPPPPGAGPCCSARAATWTGRWRPPQRSLSLFDGLPMPFERARTLFVTRPDPPAPQGEAARPRGAERGARDVRGARHARSGPTGPGPSWPGSRSASAATGLTPTEETDRAAGGRGPDQPRDRRPDVPEPEDRRGEPHPHLPQARRALPGRPGAADCLPKGDGPQP